MTFKNASSIFIEHSKKLNEQSLLYNLEKVNYLDKQKKYYFIFNHTRYIYINQSLFSSIYLNNDIKFIDPRGYFGNTMLFGIPEYDIAKVFFALSGYDHFDNQIIEELNIINDNINIKLESYDFDSVYNLFPLYSKNFIIILMITIWLGNAHIYKSNINKCITSYFIGLLQAINFLESYERF